MGNLNHISSVKKANAVIKSVEILWKEGKTLKDYITQGLKTGRQERILKGQSTYLPNDILKMNKKGFSTRNIANFLELDINFVKNAVAKQI